jgi:hypothetical protein
MKAGTRLARATITSESRVDNMPVTSSLELIDHVAMIKYY